MGRYKRYKSNFSLLRRQCDIDGHLFNTREITRGKWSGLVWRECKLCNHKQLGSWEYKNKRGYVFKVMKEGRGYFF